MADNFAFPYYVDASALDDTGSGTAISPKKFYRSLGPSLNYRQGQAILLRPGRFYDVASVGAGIGGIFRSHVTIKPWDNGESGAPCFDGRNWIAPITDIAQSRFTKVGAAAGGGYIWSIIVGTQNPVMRVFAASQNNGVLLSQRTMGEGLGTTPDAVADDVDQIKAALNERDCWHGAGLALGYALYMWTPSELIDPTMYYQGMSFYQHGAGTFGFDVGILISSNATDHAQDVTVQDVDVIGATGACVSVNTTDASRPISNIRIERVSGHGIVRSGVVVRPGVSAAGIASGVRVISDVSVRGCRMNGTLSAKEEERTRAYSHFTVADMYTIFDSVDNVVMEDCVSIDPRHTGFAMGNYSANSTLPRRSGFRRCVAVANPRNTYARGFAISMTEDTCSVEQCTLDGMNVASQAAGSVLLAANVHKNARLPLRMADLADPADAHLSIYSNVVDRGTPNIGNERYIYSNVVNVRLYNNSFGPLPSTKSPVIKLAAFGTTFAGLPPATFGSNAITAANNVFLDTAPHRKTMPVITTETSGAATIGDIVFDTSVVRKADGAAPTVMYRGTSYGINSAPGFTGNLTIDPKVDRDLRPLRGSPLAGSGRVLGRAMRDAGGRERPARSTIGAFEDFNVYSRQARV